MNKPLVFISHISDEKEVAFAFKELVESSFLGMIDVFVSSDLSSVPLGQKWLDNITESLKICVVEIVICSPKSVTRTWIHFEAGAGWVRDISVIPLCHSGIEPATLPIPLNLLQAAKATEISSLKLILPVLAHAIGSHTPSVDFTDFIDKVKNFESVYTFWDECNTTFRLLNRINVQIIPALQQGKTIAINLTETEINQVNKIAGFLRQYNILQFQRSGNATLSTNGMFYEFEITPLAKFQEIVRDKMFKL